MSRHLDDLIVRQPDLGAIRGSIELAFALLEKLYRSGGTMLLCGNGGSAADCEHWSGELLKSFEYHRPPKGAEKLPPELARIIQEALPAIPLTVFASLRTAFVNDVDPYADFAQLVWALGKPGDVLCGLSTSGNAKNVCLAAKAAKAKGMSVLALTGAKGGMLAGLADVAVKAPATRTCLVQEQHLPIYHTLCLMLEEVFFPAPARPGTAPA